MDNLTAHLLIIEIPINIYRLKVQNKYIPLDYVTEMEGGILYYTHFRKFMFNPAIDWTNHKRTYITTYSKDIDQAELGKSLKNNPNVTQEIRERIISLIKKYWYFFAKQGCRRTIVGYEFAIDVGSALPFFCRKPQYSPQDSDVIMEQIQYLLGNNWTEEFDGPLGSQIVLAPKPHQEHISNIDHFI